MNQALNVVSMLQHFGLSSKEANTYLACLELGPSSIQKLSKHTRLNRSTVHFIAESLKKKGLFAETRKGKKRLLFAENPKKFERMVREDREHVKLKEHTLEDLLPILSNLTTADDKKPQVRFYEGAKGFYDICDRSLDKADGEILFLSNLTDFRKVGNDERYDEGYYVPKRIKKGHNIKMLVFRNEISEKYRKLDVPNKREVRFLPKSFEFRSTIFIYSDEFSMVCSKPPFLGVVIKSKELSHTMRQIYGMLWAVSE